MSEHLIPQTRRVDVTPARESERQGCQQVSVIEPAVDDVRLRGFDYLGEARETAERAQLSADPKVQNGGSCGFQACAQGTARLQADHRVGDRLLPIARDQPGEYCLGSADIERRDDMHHLDGQAGCAGVGGKALHQCLSVLDPRLRSMPARRLRSIAVRRSARLPPGEWQFRYPVGRRNLRHSAWPVGVRSRAL